MKPVPRIGIIIGVGLDWREAPSPFVLRKHIILIYTIVLFGYGIKDICHGEMTEEHATCQIHNINIGDTNLTPMSYRATQLCDCNKGFQCASLELGKT